MSVPLNVKTFDKNLDRIIRLVNQIGHLYNLVKKNIYNIKKKTGLVKSENVCIIL